MELDILHLRHTVLVEGHGRSHTLARAGGRTSGHPMFRRLKGGHGARTVLKYESEWHVA